MDGARFVSVVRGDKDVKAESAQRLTAAQVERTTSEDGDAAVKLNLQSKLELISDVKELRQSNAGDTDEGAFAVRSLNYISRLAGKVQKLLEDNGVASDSKREQKVQELLNELARVVGADGGPSEYDSLVSGAFQISSTLKDLSRRGDSADTFADSLSGAASFFSSALIDRVGVGDVEGVFQFANNLSDIKAVTQTYVSGGISAEKVSGEVLRLSNSALQAIGKDEAKPDRAANVIEVIKDALSVVPESIKTLGDAKRVLGEVLGKLKQGINLDDLVRAPRDRVA